MITTALMFCAVLATGSGRNDAICSQVQSVSAASDTRCVELEKILRTFESNPERVPTEAEWQQLVDAVFCGPEDSICSTGLVAHAINIATRRVTPDDVAARCETHVLSRKNSLLRSACVSIAASSERPRAWLIKLIQGEDDPEVTRVVFPLIDSDERLVRKALPIVIALVYSTRNLHVRADAARFVTRHAGVLTSTSTLLLTAAVSCDPQFRRSVRSTLDEAGKVAADAMCAALLQPRIAK
jgi:hypothetical protein